MPDDDDSFESEAQQDRESLVSEFLYFLREEKKWWLAPILIIILVLSAFVYFSVHGAAPFIYTLF